MVSLEGPGEGRQPSDLCGAYGDFWPGIGITDPGSFFMEIFCGFALPTEGGFEHGQRDLKGGPPFRLRGSFGQRDGKGRHDGMAATDSVGDVDARTERTEPTHEQDQVSR